MGFNSGFKGLNAELNPICHFLALLGAHPILHVSRIRVKNDYLVWILGSREKRLLAASCPSVCPQASTRIPRKKFGSKFDTRDFHENRSRKSTFGWNRKTKNKTKKISRTLHEDLSIFYILHRSTKYCIDRQQCKGKLVLRFNGKNQQLYITNSDTRTSRLKKKLTVAVLLQQWLREHASVTSHEHCRNAFPMWYKPSLLNIIQFSPSLGI